MLRVLPAKKYYHHAYENAKFQNGPDQTIMCLNFSSFAFSISNLVHISFRFCLASGFNLKLFNFWSICLLWNHLSQTLFLGIISRQTTWTKFIKASRLHSFKHNLPICQNKMFVVSKIFTILRPFMTESATICFCFYLLAVFGAADCIIYPSNRCGSQGFLCLVKYNGKLKVIWVQI